MRKVVVAEYLSLDGIGDVPLFLGSGRRWFGDRRETTALSLTDVRTTAAGVVMLTYERAAKPGDASTTANGGEGDWWLRRRQSSTRADRSFPIASLTTSSCVPPPGP